MKTIIITLIFKKVCSYIFQFAPIETLPLYLFDNKNLIIKLLFLKIRGQC